MPGPAHLRAPSGRPHSLRRASRYMDMYESCASLNRLPSIASSRPQAVNLGNFAVHFVLLTAIGVLAALTALLTSGLILQGTQLRASLPLAAEVPFAVVFAVAAALVTRHLGPEAAGGGLVQVKTILSGLIHPAFLSPRVLLTKVLGLVCSGWAGLSVGREGPFIHISVAIADNLMQRVRLFRHVRLDAARRLETLAAACAAGVSATFGTPFGSVLFSVEVTATYYMVRNIPRAFFAAIAGALAVHVLGYDSRFFLFSLDGPLSKPMSPADLVVFVALGCICGALACLFIVLAAWLVRWHRAHNSMVAVVLVTAALTLVVRSWFSLSTARSDDDQIAQLFQAESMGVRSELVAYIPLKFLFTALCITLPLPAGLFSPVFLCGGAIGRVFGEVVDPTTQFEPWEFALVGAAAFSAGVTRAISTGVIVLELCGKYHLVLPMGLAICCAYFIGNAFTNNIYDTLRLTSELPYMPALSKHLYATPASQIMQHVRQMPCLARDSTFRDAQRLLLECHHYCIPVVDSRESMQLMGSVTREDVKAAVMAVGRRRGGRRWSFSHDSVSSDDSEEEGEEVVEVTDVESGVLSPLAGDALRGSSRKLIGQPSELAGGDPLVFVEVLSSGEPVAAFDSSYGRRGAAIDDSRLPVIQVDPSPYVMTRQTPLNKVDLVFRMLRLNIVFMVAKTGGQLEGAITREDFMRYLQATSPVKICDFANPRTWAVTWGSCKEVCCGWWSSPSSSV